MATVDERIAALETKLKQEKARKQKIEAQKRAIESKTKRASDTRKKILLGAFMLEKMSNNEPFENEILSQLEQYLTRSDDRELFGLAVLPEIQTATTQ